MKANFVCVCAELTGGKSSVVVDRLARRLL